eukprot:g1100.t1
MQVQCHMSSWRQSKVGVVKIDAAKQMQQHKNTISDLSQSEVRYVLSTQSPLLKYHQLRYTHEHERKLKLGLRSNEARREHIKKQKAAYKRLYPSRQRTSVIIKLMKEIEQYEKSDLRLAVPSTHLSKSIPDQFGAWKSNTNVARSSKLTNFQTDTENDCSNKIEKAYKDSNYPKKCARQVSPILPKTTLRQRQLVPLECEDEHGSGATSPSTLSPSPPRNKVRRANKRKVHVHSRKLRVDFQVPRGKKINDGIAVGNSLKKMGHIFPVVLSNGIRVKREREIVPLTTPQFGLYLKTS